MFGGMKTRDLYWMLKYIQNPKHNAEIKKEIRRRRDITHDYEVVHSDPECGSAVYKFMLGEFDSKDEADEFFMENCYIKMRYEAWDCTGRSFTSWYHIFQKLDGTYWCYHCVSIDC